MAEKRKYLVRKQPRLHTGICFEPLEPRLLLSGDWGAGAGAPAPGSRATTGEGFGHETMALHEAADTGQQSTRHQNQSDLWQRVDLLANMPPMNVFTADQTNEAPGQSLPNAGPAGTVTMTRELVFVDAGIQDYSRLVGDILKSADQERSLEIIVLDADQDGVAQISAVLAGRQDLDAVHFISHGTDGAVTLGAAVLDSHTLERYAGDIAGWKDALAPEADLLFYGCNLATGDGGRALLNRLATLTGTDVAASDDLTGGVGSGGDWALEYTAGHIETAVAVNPMDSQSWSGTLAAFTVDTTADTVDANPGDGIAADASGYTSLRAAIMEANALAGADTITLGAGTYTLTLGPAGDDNAQGGDLDITSEMTIAGADAAATVIDGNGLDRVLHLKDGQANLTLSDVTIQNGRINDKGGGIYIDHDLAQLDASRVIITGNIADDGAGIFNDGTMTLTDVVISNNGDGTTKEGGGIHNKGAAVLDRVTISGNQAEDGGGIHDDNAANVLSLTNVTVSGNTASIKGGGLNSEHAASILNSTFTLNSAGGNGGGICINGATVDLLNSIAAGNTSIAAADLQGNLNSSGYNLIGNPTGGSGFVGSDITGVSAQLGALADNGGFGPTHALLAGSPAIDPAGLSGAPGLDQRGLARDTTPDMGAYEYIAENNNAGTVTIDNATPAQGDTLTAGVSDADGISGGISYQWFRDGVAIAGATGAVYTTVEADVGRVITVTADYTDDALYVESLTSAGTAAVTNVNDAPVLGNNQLTISEGAVVIFDSTMLSATDVDNPDAGLTFTITAATGGRFERVSTGLVMTSFTQADITAGEVRFVHFGGEAAPTYSVTVTDGAASSATVPASITFTGRNDPPTVALNTGTTVVEGANGRVITSAMLNAGDPDDGGTGLVYTVTAVAANGTLRLNGTALALNDTFTQDDIDNGRVTYDHDGSDTVSDSFDFSLADGGEDGAAAATGSFAITITPVNDNDPVAVNDTITVNLGAATTTLSGGQTSVLFNDTDADLPSDTLSVTLGSGPGHGSLTLNADGTFSYTHDGSLNVSDSFTYIVSDANGGATATGTVSITVTGSPSGPTTEDPPDTDGDTTDPAPDPDPVEEDSPAEPDADPVEDPAEPTVPPAVPSAPVPGMKPVSMRPGIADGRLQMDGLISETQPTVSRIKAVAQRLYDTVRTSLKDTAARTGDQLADQQARLYNLMSAQAYVNMANALDELKQEVSADNQAYKVYLGPAIVSSVGLSVGYVVWMIRGGMLLTSLLSSLPAWQFLDPLPILAGKKGDDPSDDDESLESMLDRKPTDGDKEKKIPGDASRAGAEK